ncbi:MFS transporter [Streptomyces sp. P9(2023)]|uniref:MFS transporter n=1 Tax=Streptomyces sp. P9(2023) TaxID=3064394 RepID=UPI0037DCFD38
MGILMALGGIAPIVAPLAGGAVIEAFGRRGVFWVLAVIAAVVAVTVVVAVPDCLPAERRRTGGAAELGQQLRSVVRDRAYVGYTLAFGVLFCSIAGSPFLLQNVLGLGVGASSVAFSAGAVVATVAGAVSARSVGRVAPELPETLPGA